MKLYKVNANGKTAELNLYIENNGTLFVIFAYGLISESMWKTHDIIDELDFIGEL